MTIGELYNFTQKMANLEANRLKSKGLSLQDAKDTAEFNADDKLTHLLLYEILRELRRIK